MSDPRNLGLAVAGIAGVVVPIFVDAPDDAEAVSTAVGMVAALVAGLLRSARDSDDVGAPPAPPDMTAEEIWESTRSDDDE